MLGVAVALGGMGIASALQSQLLAIVGIVAGGSLVLHSFGYYGR